jgi:mono/diheme cytochrome c family protein
LHSELRRLVVLICPFVVLTAGASVTMTTTGCHKSAPMTSEQIFVEVCSRCHGPDGSGGHAPFGGRAPRNFRDPEFQKNYSDASIAAAVRNGKPPGMPAFGAAYSDEQLAGLVKTIRSFAPPKK